ncbi:hypothetical protein GGI07_003743 [Coemansia sp. Benny D115]|nr:hypothetical protein GGI07_003743 [Coemansia sp. Benny D115]
MGQPRLRLVNKETEDLDDVTPSASPQNQSDVNTAAARPKRARKSDANTAAPGSADSTPAPGATEADSTAAQTKSECLRLYQAIKEMEKDGEPLCLEFNKLPPKRDYPDYYVEIKQPVALDIIKGRITRNQYKTVASFVSDVNLMCDNAQQYNIPDSYIYVAAGDIKQNINKLAAASISKERAAVGTPVIRLKLSPEQPRAAAENSSAAANGPMAELPDESASAASKGKTKRKRASDSDDAATESNGSGAQPPPMPTGDMASTVDELFQAIYDADLGVALKILDTPGLPLNEHRQVVLKDQASDSEDTSTYTWGPLHAAACYGRLKVAQVLCEKGADIEAVDTMHKSTPLAWAAYTGRKRLAKYLVRAFKANVNARNAHDQLPIQIVLDPENPKWAEFLLPTDGTVVDLPLPVERSSTPEPKKTPSRKTKGHAGDDPSSRATPSAGSKVLTQPMSSRPDALAASHTNPSKASTPAGPSSGALPHTLAQNGSGSAPTGPGSVIPQCIGGIGHQEIVHPKMAEAMTEILQHILGFEDDEGTRLAEVFEELPDRDEYPEYYDVISHPMAFSLVQTRISAGYRSFDAFNYDMLWVFNNATFFNESDSQIYKDAVILEKEYKAACRRSLKKHEIPFDTSYLDAVPPEGRYVSRVTAGDHDLFVGDFIYVKSGNEMRIAMITKLRVGGAYDRRKFIDGRWFLKPSEIPELAGQPVYPHQLFAGPEFDSHGVRGISGKCYVLLPNVYARVYPQGYSPQDLFVCESAYELPTGEGRSGMFKPIANWAHFFKTPLMHPPNFVSYIAPFVPSKRPAEMWNNVNLLPHPGLTMLNRDAMRLYEQNQARMRSQSQQQQQQHQSSQPPPQLQQQHQHQHQVAPMQMPMSMPMSMPMQMAMANNGRPPMQPMVPMSVQMQVPATVHNTMPLQPQLPNANISQVRPPIQNNLTQAYQALSVQHQQNLATLQAQMNQHEATVRKQVNEKMFAMQQRNPNYIGSPEHQALIKQQSQFIEQNQQAYFAQVQKVQQAYNQQIQALNQTFQQQQKHQLQNNAMQPMSSPMAAIGQPAGPFGHASPGMVPLSPAMNQLNPGMNQLTMSSPLTRASQVPMAVPMSPLGAVSMAMPGMVPQTMIPGVLPAGTVGMTSAQHANVIRPSPAMSAISITQGPQTANTPQPFDRTLTSSHDPQRGMNGVFPGSADRAHTPAGAASSTPLTPTQLGLSSPLPPGANAQAMMSMLLQQQQQQQQQQHRQLQQPGTPKPTVTPLSPEMVASPGSNIPNGHAAISSASPRTSQSLVAPQAQSRQAMEAWNKITRVFLTHGNSRISKDLGIQLATPDSSMFIHISLGGIDTNHALSIPPTANTILLRPVPGPFAANGNPLVMLSANGRRQLPRIITDASTQPNEDGTVEETSSSSTAEDADKEESSALEPLVKSANYAYEVPLQSGMNFVDMEVLVEEWSPHVVLNEGVDQRVPPTHPANIAGQKQKSKHFMIFLTRT